MPNPFIVAGTSDSFTFNGPIKEIEVGAATSQFNVQNVYSFWKQWVSESNAQYLPAFRPVGGDDLGGDNAIAFYAFLANNWRVRVPAELTELLVLGGVLLTEELDNPFRFDGVLITLQQPLAVQAIQSPNTTQILSDIAALLAGQNDTIIPNQVSIAATADKTYEKVVSIGATADKTYTELVSIGNTVGDIYNNTVGINNVVIDTNNRVVAIGATTLDIKKNTNLIPALL
jgi:hypothetical protein